MDIFKAKLEFIKKMFCCVWFEIQVLVFWHETHWHPPTSRVMGLMCVQSHVSFKNNFNVDLKVGIEQFTVCPEIYLLEVF